MDRHPNKLRFIFAICLTVLCVSAARAALPAEGVTQPVLDPKVVNGLAMQLGKRVGD